MQEDRIWEAWQEEAQGDRGNREHQTVTEKEGVQAEAVISSIRNVALTKGPPAFGDLFFQAKALGASPIKRY